MTGPTLLCLTLLTSQAAAWPSDEAAEQSYQSSDNFNRQVLAAGATAAEPFEFFRDNVDSGVQSHCLTCHRAGGSAPESGARLVLGENTQENHSAFVSLFHYADVSQRYVLSKITGGTAHGGGAVVAEGSTLYRAFEDYLALLQGDDGGSSVEEDFWNGTEAESREVTLRRAALLFSGEVPGHGAIEVAKESDEKLRFRVLTTMQGEGFRDFLMGGANDQLLISGLANGIDFNISTYDRYPMLAELMRGLPDERPEEFEDYHDRPYLARGDAQWMFTQAVGREPLELIAHVVMTDRPYTEVLTADYTMVNAFSDLAYRSETGFSHEFADEDGFYDRRPFGIFKPGYNDGHIPHDEEYEYNEEEGKFSFSDYQQWPHAGVLSTQAWLARYPSTDTNRNRARARWTYFHFLGVDIEKSAPRSTDPDALADTDNPTMKNPACTVCHERLDPVAGAYQSFGDIGHYLDQFGGRDSLSDAYKCPECYGGELGSTDYQEGDTWYRDMRTPGFEGERAGTEFQDSLQWLAQEIVTDPRFAAATVRFWWPAVFGSEPLSPPADATADDADQHIRAFNAQESLVAELAAEFQASNFDLKSLLADMVMSPWYRHSSLSDSGDFEARQVELATVGRGKLLTPEELDRKNRAVFGRTWRQWGDGSNPHSLGLETAFVGQWAPFSTFYGGIDGAVVTKRNRNLTPLMSNVTESMAIDLACQVVIEDFNRSPSERKVFRRVDRHTIPGEIKRTETSLRGKVDDTGQMLNHTVAFDARFVGGGPTKLKVADLTRDSHQSLDGNWTGAELIVRSITLLRNGSAVKRFWGENFSQTSGFAADTWTDEDGRQHWRGQSDGEGWRMHSGAWVEIETDLGAGDYEVKVELGSSLMRNNANDAMTSSVSATATKNIGQTASGKAVRRQISDIVRNAYHRSPVNAEIQAMLNQLLASSVDAKSRTSWYRDQGNHCDTWSIWQNEELDHQGHLDRYGDREGMMRGWTTLVHSVMTSYGYLHD
jgi:hypothetical protein